MLHSDVVATVGSTICLDAIAFDTPVVGVGFEGEQHNHYLESYKRYFDYTHLSRVVQNGGLRVATSLDEMVDAVNAYLLNPLLDAEGRRRVRERQIFRLDGQSGVRAGRAILKELGVLEGQGVVAPQGEKIRVVSSETANPSLGNGPHE